MVTEEKVELSIYLLMHLVDLAMRRGDGFLLVSFLSFFHLLSERDKKFSQENEEVKAGERRRCEIASD